MRKNIIFLILFAIFSTMANPILAEESANPNSVLTGLPALIAKAKEQLAPIKLNYSLTPQYKTTKNPKQKTGKQVLSHYVLDAKDLALAVLDPQDNSIHTVMAIQKGKDFTFPAQYQNFEIRKVFFNGVNTRFEVKKPAGGKVLALKYLITPKESGSKNEITSAMYDGVYVPYSPELVDDELSALGAKYLDGVIDSAATRLFGQPSVSSPGKSVPEAISKDLVRALIYAEHMDTTEFLSTPNTGDLAKKVNVLLAGNQGDTWKYSVSSAGAAGISQFIPSTYSALVKRHSGVRLNPDFVAGMRDHTNAVTATFLLLDDYIEAVRSRAPEHFLDGHRFDYGAAAYNGGPVRVARATKTYGTEWYKANFDKVNDLKNQIAKGEQNLSSIRAKFFASKDKKLKAELQKQADSQRAETKKLKEELEKVESATLRQETVHYLEKIHRLIQHFQSNTSKQLVTSR